MARVVHDQQHRKELVAGGMADYLLASKSWTVKQSFFVFTTIPGYRDARERLGNRATDFFEVNS
jgi:hypothetical protein